MEITVSDNPTMERYEAVVDGRLAGFAHYRMRPDGVAITHTEVLPEFEGHGIGARLARAALDDIRARGQRVIPLCPFVAAFIRRHPEYADLTVDRYRGEVA